MIDRLLESRRTFGLSVDPSAVTRTFYDILAFAKTGCNRLPRIKIHELRDTSATLLLSAGVSPKVVIEPARSQFCRDHLGYLFPRPNRSAEDCQ